ncbi:hypothetical protein WJ970_34540 [Achromobacter xylosoxidans]
MPPTAKLTGPATAEGGATVLLSGKNSNNGGGKLTYLWKLPTGITAPVNQADLSFVAPKLSQDKAYTFGLTVTNEKGSSLPSTPSRSRSRTRAAAAPAAASTRPTRKARPTRPANASATLARTSSASRGPTPTGAASRRSTMRRARA